MGYFIPTQGQMEADVAALKKASQTLDKLMAEQGIELEAVVADFKAQRRKAITVPARKVKTKAA